MDKNKALQIEKDKRKIIATRRICFVLAIMDVALLVYLIVQIILLAQK